MGAALDAVGDVAGPIRKNPILLAGALVAGVILAIGLVISFIPFIGSLIYGLVITPIALAGMVTMTDTALEESTTLGEFTDGIQEHATTMMGAYGILFLIQFGIGLILVTVLIAVGIGSLVANAPSTGSGAGSGMSGVGTATAIVLAVLILAVLVTMVVLGFVQAFLDVAVVVGGESGVEAVKEAWQVLRQGPVSALGYALVRLGVTLVAAIPTVALFALAVSLGSDAVANGSLSSVSAAVGLLGVVTIPLPFLASVVYHVSYYRRRRGTPPGERPSTGHGHGQAPASGQDRRRTGTRTQRRQREGTGGSQQDPQAGAGAGDDGADESGFQFD